MERSSSPQPRTAFKRIGVLYHPKIEKTHPIADDIFQWLKEHGLEAWKALTWEEEDVAPHLPDTDLLIVLGGDGSMLRAARMAAGYQIPIMGVNMGRLGFLTEVTPDNWQEKMPNVLAGEYWLEERMMLQAEAWRKDELLCEHPALNDIVISRGTLARVVELATDIDDTELTTYVADGLIISTPTGSTAYALAVGGPVLPPDLRNILVIPIAPHLTLDRAIVLSEGAMVSVNVSTDHQAILTVDGQFAIELEDGDRVDIHTSTNTSRFIRMGERTYFYHMLLERLEPKRVDGNAKES